ncbi:MAG: hypothetical protein QNJ69_13270 [Gammaproteobacteria bacterium]|nr:hypothetical protein [Gammaproteobacteria bacterium]
MKKLANVFALLFLTPLTVLAHPGHDYYVEHRWLDFISQDSFIVFTLVLLGLVYALIRMSLIKSPTSVNSDKAE